MLVLLSTNMESPPSANEEGNNRKWPYQGRYYQERQKTPEEVEREERQLLIIEYNMMREMLDKMRFRMTDLSLKTKRDLPFLSWCVCPTESLFIWVTFDQKVW